MDAIIRANPGLNAERLKVDEELTIPPRNSNSPTPVPRPRQYTVRAGDTFSVIAQRFGLTGDELSRYNPQINPDRLSIGDVLYVP